VQAAGWMCSHADLVLVMEASHQQALEKLYPTARGKIRRPAEFGPPGGLTLPTLTASPALPKAHMPPSSPWRGRVRHQTVVVRPYERSPISRVSGLCLWQMQDDDEIDPLPA
jgi:protein-tyrosine-phosphatase